MKISFDVDDTIICHYPDVPNDLNKVPRLLRHWFPEPLRQGTKDLMIQLSNVGWEIAIYTTSERSPRYLRWLLRFYGIQLGVVVNRKIHETELKRKGFSKIPSKYPKAFDIDLHVDDSEGVRIEGDEWGFPVIVVNKDDLDWGNKVLVAARQFQSLKAG